MGGRLFFVLMSLVIGVISCGVWMYPSVIDYIIAIDYLIVFKSVISFIVAMTLVVGFHEFGHYLIARIAGVRVLEFSIGFGKTLISFKSKKSGIKYKLSLMPLGGFVRFLDGEKDRKEFGDYGLSFGDASVAKRSAIVFAGPLFNAIFAFLVFVCISVIGTPYYKPFVGDTISGGWADSQGIKPGDLIVSIDNMPVVDFPEMFQTIASNAGKSSVSIVVQNNSVSRDMVLNLEDMRLTRDGASLERLLGIKTANSSATSVINKIGEGGIFEKLNLTPGDRIVSINDKETATPSKIQDALKSAVGDTVKVVYVRGGKEKTAYGLYSGLINAGFEPYKKELFIGQKDEDFLGVISSSYDRLVVNTASTLSVLSGIFNNSISMDVISGPVGIAKAAGDFMEFGAVPFLHFMAMISISLMVMNLIPVPGLDGFYLVVFGIESIIRRKIPEKYIDAMIKVGMTAIAALLAYALYIDFKFVF
jgi:regulator of sigma E protease